MKKLILTAIMALLFVHLKAQVIEVKQVPVPVVTTFQTAYPDVTGVQWRKAGTMYIANYNQNSNEMYVTYDPEGKMVESGQTVVVTSAPAPMTTYVKTKYKDGKITKVYRVKDSSGKTIWKGKVKNDYVLFDESGNFIKVEKED